jgi:hypothetical protein
LVTHIFIGPTLAGQDVLDILPGAVVHPPVAHGDLLKLDLVGGDVVVIVDGYYHQSASVRHKEILALLADGVVVIGCASMGALRAAELAEYGMIGNGAVYRMYRDGVVDADEEVAIAHTPGPDYRSFTVPTVVIRHAIGMAVRSGVLDHISAASIIGIARGINYTERSWQAIERAVDGDDSTAAALARLREFVDSQEDATDIKVADVLDTFRKIANGELRSDRNLVESWVFGDWCNRFLDEWRSEFSISVVDETEVSDSAILRYQQLYCDDFPDHWKRFALSRIAGAEIVEPDLVGRALAKAARSGLDSTAMTGERLRYWLTEREIADLSADDMLLRVLVRSYLPLSPARDLLEAQPGLIEDDAVRRMVGEATVVNAEVASWGDKRTVDHLRLATLRAHLALVWRIEDADADADAMLAAARDRGFESVDAAVDAARMFYLHKSFLGAAR